MGGPSFALPTPLRRIDQVIQKFWARHHLSAATDRPCRRDDGRLLQVDHQFVLCRRLNGGDLPRRHEISFLARNRAARPDFF